MCLQVSSPPVSVLGAGLGVEAWHLLASLGDLSGPALCAFTQALKTPLFCAVRSASSRADLPGFDREAVHVMCCGLSLGRPSSPSRSVSSYPHAPPPPRGILIAPSGPFGCSAPSPALRAAPTAPPGRGQPSLPTPALHCLPATAPAGQLPAGGALGVRSRRAVEGPSQCGCGSSEGSEQPRGGVLVQGSPGPPRQEARLLTAMQPSGRRLL